jgi:hypothetical protein
MNSDGHRSEEVAKKAEVTRQVKGAFQSNLCSSVPICGFWLFHKTQLGIYDQLSCKPFLAWLLLTSIFKIDARSAFSYHPTKSARMRAMGRPENTTLSSSLSTRPCGSAPVAQPRNCRIIGISLVVPKVSRSRFAHLFNICRKTSNPFKKPNSDLL